MRLISVSSLLSVKWGEYERTLIRSNACYFYFSAYNFKPALGKKSYRLREYLMLQFQNPLRKGFLSILKRDRNSGLDNYRACVHPLVNKMHSTS